MHYAFMLVVAAGIYIYMTDFSSGFDEGMEALESGHYEEAADEFTRAINSGVLEDKNLAAAYNNRGVAYYNLGRFDAALSDYRQAIRLQPRQSTFHRNLSGTLLMVRPPPLPGGPTALAQEDRPDPVERDQLFGWL